MNINRLTRLGIAGALTLAQWALCLTLLGYSQPLTTSGALVRSATPSAVTASRTAGTPSQIFTG
jgi:hypothetical protein